MKRHFKHESESDLGTGTVYLEVVSGWPSRQVEVYGERPRVGLPRIGAGLGGLPWQEVRSELSAIGDATSVALVVFEEYERSQ